MKTLQGSDQSQGAMLLALAQVAELARELCRPCFSEVDNAIGRYLLVTVQPLLSEPPSSEAPAPAGSLSPRLSLARLFGRRRGEDGRQPASVTGVGRPFNVTDGRPIGGGADSRYEIAEAETFGSVH